MKSRFFLWCLLVLCLIGFGPVLDRAFGHELQVRPVSVTIRPQQGFLIVDMAGNGEDALQAVNARPDEVSATGFASSVEPRFEAYVNDRFVLSQGGQKLTGQLIALEYSRPNPNDYITSNFAATLRYERPVQLADQPFGVENRLFDFLPNARTALTVAGYSRLLPAGERLELDPGQVSANLMRNVWDFGVLGAEHIFLGPDHLLFVLALLVTSTSLWSLVKTLTGFTIAHSITLILSATQVLTFPELYTEILIAASIIYVGLENLFFPKAERYRFFLAGAFGLVHGFGFAYTLHDRLPDVGLWWSLLSFNVGVEVAQVVVCVIAWPLLMMLRRRLEAQARYGGFGWSRAVQVTSWFVVLAGGFWMVERLVSG